MSYLKRNVGAIVFLLILSLVWGCKPTKDLTTKKETNASAKTSSGMVEKRSLFVEDFDDFYGKFHADSVFQISRVKFPVAGSFTSGDSVSAWTKENWGMMKVKVFDVDKTIYRVDYKRTEKTFTQRIWLENSGFSSECRFELIKGKWYLVYSMESNM